MASGATLAAARSRTPTPSTPATSEVPLRRKPPAPFACQACHHALADGSGGRRGHRGFGWRWRLGFAPVSLWGVDMGAVFLVISRNCYPNVKIQSTVFQYLVNQLVKFISSYTLSVSATPCIYPTYFLSMGK
jgi:hypothetical protein